MEWAKVEAVGTKEFLESSSRYDVAADFIAGCMRTHGYKFIRGKSDICTGAIPYIQTQSQHTLRP
jgi:hypothetical protein